MRKINPPQEALLPIREVAKITGVNPITLRAWERRYSLIEPIRTDSGHRLYTHDNINTLKEVIRLTHQGVPIGQVKALLDKPNKPVMEPQTEADLESLLLETLETADLKTANELLDRLMADYTSHFWQRLFSRITLSLSETSIAGKFWFSLMMPRLMSRLHLSYRHLKTDVRPVWVQCSANTNELWGLLAAHNLVEQGYYPLLQPAGDMNFDLLLTTLQSLYCHGIAWVTTESSSELEAWRQWTSEHPSFELFLFQNQPDLSAFGQMQVRLIDLTNFESTNFAQLNKTPI